MSAPSLNILSSLEGDNNHSHILIRETKRKSTVSLNILHHDLLHFSHNA